MLLNLTDLSDEPLQSQISRQVRAKVLNGELAAGTMLPSIRVLAREQKVSVITVQRGYEALEREGLIISRRGKGFFINVITSNKKKKLAEERLSEKMSPFIKNALDEGMGKDEIKILMEKLISKL